MALWGPRFVEGSPVRFSILGGLWALSPIPWTPQDCEKQSLLGSAYALKVKVGFGELLSPFGSLTSFGHWIIISFLFSLYMYSRRFIKCFYSFCFVFHGRVNMGTWFASLLEPQMIAIFFFMWYCSILVRIQWERYSHIYTAGCVDGYNLSG